jgi:nucleoside-diphosphate-sugar epimerase
VSGALGRRVAELLAEREHVHTIIGVDVHQPGSPLPKTEFHRIDLAASGGGIRADLERVMAGAEAVLHLAWQSTDGRDAVEDDASAARANSAMVAQVLDATASTGASSFVLLSSATVYGAWPDNTVPLTEEARLRPNPEFSFAVSKAECERMVAEWAGDHPSVNVSVLRPAVTVGVGEAPLYRALGATSSPRSGDGSRPVQYLHIDDLARAVVVAYDRRLSGVYNVAPDAGIREEEARSLAGGVAKLTLPSRVAAAVSVWSWQLWRKGAPAEVRAYSTHPWVVASDRLKAAGWRPEYSSEEAIVATDTRSHWDDLPPGTRQNYNLVVLIIASAGAIAGVGAVVTAFRRLRRRSRG